MGNDLSEFGQQRGGFIDFTQALLAERKVKRLREADIVGLAQLRPNGAGFEILFRPKPALEIRRFAIAHELGHTLWYRRGAPPQPLSPYQHGVGGDLTIELLCQRFAAALLLPSGKLRDWVSRSGLFPENDPPPLNLIPLIAKRYLVSELAAARRLLQDVFPRKLGLICIRRESTQLGLLLNNGDESRWVTSWCAVPWGYMLRIRGRAIALKGHGRRIPQGMVPNAIDCGGSTACMLDSRWWDALKPEPPAAARIPLKHRKEGAQKPGFVWGDSERLYLALPLSEENCVS
jgi:hypothetical protein